jgi:hypothetical protein
VSAGPGDAATWPRHIGDGNDPRSVDLSEDADTMIELAGSLRWYAARMEDAALADDGEGAELIAVEAFKAIRDILFGGPDDL